MDVVDQVTEAQAGAGMTADNFLRLTFVKSEMRNFFDRQAGVLKTYRVETRKCDQTGLTLQCRFPVDVRKPELHVSVEVQPPSGNKPRLPSIFDGEALLEEVGA